jgi:hypothetical protein
MTLNLKVTNMGIAKNMAILEKGKELQKGSEGCSI